MVETKYWTIVINNCTKDDWEFMAWLGEDDNTEYLIFQAEVGEKGTPHLQGYLCLKMKRRFQSLRKEHPTWHLEARQGSHDDNVHYCSKPHVGCECKHCYKILVKKQGYVEYGPYIYGDDTDIPRTDGKVDNVWKEIQKDIKDGKNYNEIQEKYIGYAARYHKFIKGLIKERDEKLYDEMEKEDIKEKSLYVFQQKVVDLIPDLAPRKILWICGKKGQEGKSFIGDYLRLNNNAYVTKNIPWVECNYLYKQEKIIVFDFVRTDEKIPYKQLETYSDGRVTSTKYEPERKYVKDPKVICLSNTWPEVSKITLSRWVLYEVKDDDLILIDVDDIRKEQLYN